MAVRLAIKRLAHRRSPQVTYLFCSPTTAGSRCHPSCGSAGTSPPGTPMAVALAISACAPPHFAAVTIRVVRRAPRRERDVAVARIEFTSKVLPGPRWPYGWRISGWAPALSAHTYRLVGVRAQGLTAVLLSRSRLPKMARFTALAMALPWPESLGVQRDRRCRTAGRYRVRVGRIVGRGCPGRPRRRRPLPGNPPPPPHEAVHPPPRAGPSPCDGSSTRRPWYGVSVEQQETSGRPGGRPGDELLEVR